MDKMKYIVFMKCKYLCCCLQEKREDISIVVVCNASDIKGYDRRIPNLSNALPHVKRDSTSHQSPV